MIKLDNSFILLEDKTYFIPKESPSHFVNIILLTLLLFCYTIMSVKHINYVTLFET